MAKLLNKVIQSFGNILQKCCSERPVTKKFSNLTQQTTFYCAVKMQNCDIISMQTTRKFLVMIFRYKIKDENSICF